MPSPATARLRKAALTLVGGVAIAVSLATGAAHAAPSPQDLQSQLDAKGRQLDAVVEQYNGLNLQLSQTTAAAQAAAAKVAPLQTQADAADAVVADLATQAYEGRTVSGVSALITAGSPELFLDQLTLMHNLSSQQKASVTSLKSATIAAQQQKAHLDQLLTQQSQQKAALLSQRSKIESDIAALQKQRNALNPRSSTSTASYTGPVPAVSGSAGVAVRYAYAQIGKPYVFGANGPNSFDCSGLTQAAWARAGVSLSHFTGAQLKEAAVINRSQLQPGDLVFFYGGGHVGIYVGNNQVIHAPQPGEQVKLSSMTNMSYYASRRPH